MPKKRKKYPKLPNSFGSIRYLGANRRNCYAVHPPATMDSLGRIVRPAAICYVDDWIKGFTVLTAYKAGTYQPGMEKELPVSPTADADVLINRIIADYSMFKGVEDKHPEIKKLTFSEVYQQFLKWKFESGAEFSLSTKEAYGTAYSNCSVLHNRIFEDLKAPDLQAVLDNCNLKKASLRNILVLFKQIYKYAIFAEIVSDDKAHYVKVNAPDDEEHGVPFTEENLRTLWQHSSDPEVQVILIMCYSGWRINEFKHLEVNLKENYFYGGMKTKAGKERIVPIHPAIRDFVIYRMNTDGCLLKLNVAHYRAGHFYPTLEKLNMAGSPKHTPHDCRHTFSMLCEKYGVRENDRKRLLGHSFRNDITNAVYGHRALEDLKQEIGKIKVPDFVTNCD